MASDITRILEEFAPGDPDGIRAVFPIVYDELKRLASGKLHGDRLAPHVQPTQLVNEAFIRLVREENSRVRNRSSFFAAASRAVRHILVETARARDAQRRGGDRKIVTLDTRVLNGKESSIDLLAFNEALDQLSVLDSRQGKIVELVVFGGLSLGEASTAAGIPLSTFKREWTTARAWLLSRLDGRQAS